MGGGEDAGRVDAATHLHQARPVGVVERGSGSISRSAKFRNVEPEVQGASAEAIDRVTASPAAASSGVGVADTANSANAPSSSVSAPRFGRASAPPRWRSSAAMRGMSTSGPATASSASIAASGRSASIA
ncbi:hypothetical protein [Agromyces marinus]|uniref:hypothetical protein n=1 Tax=Agromyces marinus TaxID=1389020 RepID=UPI002573F878|nr:hypothetical protein [Agromyces marinus]